MIVTDKIQEIKSYGEHSKIRELMSVLWRAQHYARWPRGCRDFWYSDKIELMLPDLLQLALTTKLEIRSIDLPKKPVFDSSHRNVEPKFCVPALLKLIVTKHRNSYKPFISTYYCFRHILQNCNNIGRLQWLLTMNSDNEQYGQQCQNHIFTVRQWQNKILNWKNARKQYC